MVDIDEIRMLLATILQIGERLDSYGPEDPLIGALPELDSMAVAAFLTSVEENYGISVGDDVTVEDFKSMATLRDFVNAKSFLSD